MSALFNLSYAAVAASFGLIVVAEMGDKTQFIAMSFATRYSAYKVLFGIFLATLVNFAIVVTLGQFLSTLMPLDVISLAASLSFIGFGLWTLKSKKPEKENKRASRFGVVGAVFTAFFIGEFGDKTQLAAISLAAEYQSAVSVLIGAVLGMLLADGVGIAIGVVLGKHIPQRLIRWASAVIFLLFGLVGVYEVLPPRIGTPCAALTVALLTVFCILAATFITKNREKRKV